MIEIPKRGELENQEKLIGRFLIRFEQVCVAIRVGIIYICYPEPDKTQYNNIESLLAEMYANELQEKLRSLIQDNFPDEEELKKLSNKLSNLFVKMMENRNTIVHGSIVTGRGNLNGNLSSESLLLKKPKVTASGLDKNVRIIDVKTIEKLITQLLRINTAYLILNLLSDRNPSHFSNELLQQLGKTIDGIGAIKSL